jgi:hypothetical protein
MGDPDEPSPRVLSQGESLATVSARDGIDADAIWNLEQNGDLRKLRPDPNVLAPCDVLYVPRPEKRWMPLSVGTVNTFVATPPTLFAQLRCVDSDGKPLPDTSYVIDDVDPPMTGTMTGGVIDLEVPSTLSILHVHFPDLNVCVVAQVAYLDPVDAPDATGVVQRMSAVGVPPAMPAVIDDDARRIVEAEYLDAAIRTFQQAHGIAVTGVVDHATRDALTKAHGA